jgi:SP family myo-inositol transporter-like MFS transporter 13
VLNTIDDTGVISATLVSINSSLGHELTTLDKSLITSATALFALFVSPISGVLADNWGRKRVVLLADLAFVLGAVIQAITKSVPGIIVGRSIVGLAVGAGSFVAPLYIAELAPAKFRGRLITLNVLFITIGQVVAYVVGWAFTQWGSQNTGWRWMVGLGAVPAAIQFVVMLVMPETPRWLVMVDRTNEARNVLSKVYGGGREIQGMVDVVLKGIETEVREEEEAKSGRMRAQTKKQRTAWLAGSKDIWAELFKTAGNRRALTIACLLQGLQQLCGFVRVSSFSLAFSLGFPELTVRFAELLDVLLRNNIHASWLCESNTDFYVCGYNQLYLHLCSFAAHRPRGKKTDPTLLYSYYGRWTFALQYWVSLHYTASKPYCGQPLVYCFSS